MHLLCFFLQAVIFSNNYIVVWPALPQDLFVIKKKEQEQFFNQYLKGNAQHSQKSIRGVL